MGFASVPAIKNVHLFKKNEPVNTFLCAIMSTHLTNQNPVDITEKKSCPLILKKQFSEHHRREIMSTDSHKSDAVNMKGAKKCPLVLKNSNHWTCFRENHVH